MVEFPAPIRESPFHQPVAEVPDAVLPAGRVGNRVLVRVEPPVSDLVGSEDGGRFHPVRAELVFDPGPVPQVCRREPGNVPEGDRDAAGRGLKASASRVVGEGVSLPGGERAGEEQPPWADLLPHQLAPSPVALTHQFTGRVELVGLADDPVPPDFDQPAL